MKEKKKRKKYSSNGLALMSPGKVMPCFPVFEDNQSAVQLTQNPSSNSKPIDVRHHFLRELTCQMDIKVVQVLSEFEVIFLLKEW